MSRSLRALARPVSLLALAFAATAAGAQTALRANVSEASIRLTGPHVTVPDAYRVVQLDVSQMVDRLATSPAARQPGDTGGGTMLRLPPPDGSCTDVRGQPRRGRVVWTRH